MRSTKPTTRHQRPRPPISLIVSVVPDESDTTLFGTSGWISTDKPLAKPGPLQPALSLLSSSRSQPSKPNDVKQESSSSLLLDSFNASMSQVLFPMKTEAKPDQDTQDEEVQYQLECAAAAKIQRAYRFFARTRSKKALVAAITGVLRMYACEKDFQEHCEEYKSKIQLNTKLEGNQPVNDISPTDEVVTQRNTDALPPLAISHREPGKTPETLAPPPLQELSEVAEKLPPILQPRQAPKPL